MVLRRFLIIFLYIITLSGCTAYKQTLYLRTSEDDRVEDISLKGHLPVYRIKPQDELTIVVSTSDPPSSIPFYRKIGQSKDSPTMQGGTEGVKLFNYVVDNEGFINYPILGKVNVLNLSIHECENLFCRKLQTYLNEEPNVTVRISNFKISILGEVASPGTFTIEDEKINLFQALSLAGDMTLFSDRDDVHLLRSDYLGNRSVVHLDLTRSDITSSPYFYLQQNDVIYVKPTKSKVRSTAYNSNISIWVSILGLLASIASIVMISLK